MKTETLYTGLLIGYLLGALVLVLCTGAELLTLTQVRQCKAPDELENVTRAIRLTIKAVPFAIVVLAATGIWMACLKNSAYGLGTGWVIVALSAAALFMIDVLWSRRPMKHIYSKARGSHTTPADVKSISHGVHLLRHAWVRAAALAGFVIIMAARPGLFVSTAVMLGAAWTAVLAVHFALPDYEGAWPLEDRHNVGDG